MLPLMPKERVAVLEDADNAVTPQLLSDPGEQLLRERGPAPEPRHQLLDAARTDDDRPIGTNECKAVHDCLRDTARWGGLGCVASALLFSGLLLLCPWSIPGRPPGQHAHPLVAHRGVFFRLAQ